MPSIKPTEYPDVGNYEYAPPSEGGEGVTVVKFKE